MPFDFWARDKIEYLANLEIMGGYPNGYFYPHKSITRAELVVLLVKAKNLPVEIPSKDLFLDLPAEHWASPYVEVARDKKYLPNSNNLYFHPYEKLNRLQAVRLIVRFANLDIPKNIPRAPYADVPKGALAANEIWAAKSAGILEYIPGPYFEPEKKVNRAEIAELIAKTKFARQKIEDFIKK